MLLNTIKFFLRRPTLKSAKKRKLPLLPRLLIGIVSGIVIGSLGSVFGIADTPVFLGLMSVVQTFTNLFSTFLNFIIPLLILSFVTIGLADLEKKANKLFGITLLLAYSSTILAGTIAFLVGSALLPTLISVINGGAIEGASFDPLFTIEVPPIMGIMTALVFAFTVGLGIANMKGERGQTLYRLIDDLRAIVEMVLENIIIPIIPFYIAGTFCKVAASGSLIPTVLMFAKLYILILLLQWGYILVQFIIASIFRGENHLKDLKNIIPAYLTALGTQSSAATIPVNLNAAKANNMSEDVRNFVIPLCATIHLAGDTICLTLGSMGIMYASGMQPTFATFMPFIAMLGVTMVAAPGVPGGGVMAALGIIKSMLGFTDGMSELIIALHLSQDSFGTACNITGDQAIGIIVDRFYQKMDNSKKPDHKEPALQNTNETNASDDADVNGVKPSIDSQKPDDAMDSATDNTQA